MSLEHDRVKELRIPDDARICNPEKDVVRLLGSHPARLPLRPREPNGGPEPPIPDEPPPPPVSTPDLAFQFIPCLENVPIPDVDLQAVVIAAMQDAYGDEADVRYLCSEGRSTLGIWLRPSVSVTNSEARDRGLQRIDILRSGENFAVFINSAFIRRSGQETWNNMDRRLDGNGNADSGGPVHLTGFSVSFQSPNRIVTIIDGFDERPWPDVDFHIKITDTLSVSGGVIQCQSDRDLDVDTSWLNFLTGFFLIVLPPLGIVFLIQRIMIASADAPSGQAGVGCSTAQLIPGQIMIEGGLEVNAFYNRINVSNGGIFAGGIAAPSARTPSVRIHGPTQFSVETFAPNVARNYSISTDDMRGQLQIVWTADGNVLTQGATFTNIRFVTTGTQVGQVLTRRVAVRVIDADNLVAEHEIVVRIHIILFAPEIPPVCLKKPWLPQCNPQP